MISPLNRRQFLQTSALGMATALMPQTLLAQVTDNTLGKNAATTGFNPDVELEIYAIKTSVPILAGAKTQVSRYVTKLLKGSPDTVQYLGDTYLGNRLNLQQGQKVRVHFHNQLDEINIIHWHGMHVPQQSDGHPMYAINSGESYVYEFEVLNPAGTNFYHTHTHGATARQVYQGLAGMLTVSDAQEKKLNLPHGEYDIPLVIQDRSFDNQNQLIYSPTMQQKMMGFLGETILINGQVNKEFAVKSRAYRFRVLNGSNSRIYKLGWEDGTPLTAIGTDGHLLEKPETKPYIMLAPAERVDLWLDFSDRPVGSQLVLSSLPYQGLMPAMYKMQQGRGRMGMGMMGGTGLGQGSKFALARFKVTEKVTDSPSLPSQLSTIKRFTDADVDNAHAPIEIGLSMNHMRPRINGKSFAMDKVMPSEKVALGSHKKIKIFHAHEMGGMGGMGMGGMMNMAHPIHLHGQQYQVVSRKNVSMNSRDYDTVKDGLLDKGWKDTVLVMPGEEVEIIKPFEDYKGLFLYHCHNLEHEDLGMMRQFFVN